MRCAENLVDACVRDDAKTLLVFTKQIFGMCDAHGVANPTALFDEYRDVVRRLMTLRPRGDVVGMLDALVWEPNQKNLADLLNVSRREWSSVLTAEAPPLFITNHTLSTPRQTHP